MQPFATASTADVPCLAHWLAPADVAERLGVSHLLVLTWITKGLKGERGRRRLPAKKLGGRWKIDPAAVAPFVDAMTQAALGEGVDVAPLGPSAAEGRRRVKAAMSELHAQGVGGGDDAEWVHTVGHPRGRRKAGTRSS